MKRWLKSLSPLRQWHPWKRVLVIASVLALVAVLIGIGYSFELAGFAAAGDPKTPQYRPAKTLWDWLQLLIVPVVLASAAFWFNAQQRQAASLEQQRIEREIAQDQQRETMLQGYLDRMAELLLKEHLRSSKEDEEIRHVARARTLTILRQLDPERKTALFRFLSEAQLVGDGHHIIPLSFTDLSGADLSKVDLRGADLTGADLSRANLSEADLSGANVSGGDLSGGNLTEANLRGANLHGADLTEANLHHVDLSEANLSGADLRGADLRGADLSGADLSEAKIVAEQLAEVRSQESTTPQEAAQLAEVLALPRRAKE